MAIVANLAVLHITSCSSALKPKLVKIFICPLPVWFVKKKNIHFFLYLISFPPSLWILQIMALSFNATPIPSNKCSTQCLYWKGFLSVVSNAGTSRLGWQHFSPVSRTFYIRQATAVIFWTVASFHLCRYFRDFPGVMWTRYAGVIIGTTLQSWTVWEVLYLTSTLSPHCLPSLSLSFSVYPSLFLSIHLFLSKKCALPKYSGFYPDPGTSKVKHLQ